MAKFKFAPAEFRRAVILSFKFLNSIRVGFAETRRKI